MASSECTFTLLSNFFIPDSSTVVRVPYVDLDPEINCYLENEIKAMLNGGATSSKIILLLGEAGCGKTSILLDIKERFSDSEYVHFYEQETWNGASEGHIYLVKDATAELESGLGIFFSSSPILVVIGVNYGIIGEDLEAEASRNNICVKKKDYGKNVAATLSNESKFLELLNTIITTAYKCDKCTNNGCEKRRIYDSIKKRPGRRFYRHFIYWYLTKRSTRFVSPSMLIEWLCFIGEMFYKDSGLIQSTRLNWKGIKVEDSFLTDDEFNLHLIGDPAFNEFVDIFNTVDPYDYSSLPTSLNDVLKNSIVNLVRKLTSSNLTESKLDNEYILGSVFDYLNSNLASIYHIFIKEKWHLMARRINENFIIEVEFRVRGLNEANPIFRFDYHYYKVLHRLSLGDFRINQDVDYFKFFLSRCFDAHARAIGYIDSQHLLIALGLMIRPNHIEISNQILGSIKPKKRWEYKINYIDRIATSLTRDSVELAPVDFYSPALPRDGKISLELKSFNFHTPPVPPQNIRNQEETPISPTIRAPRARVREFCIAAYNFLGYNVRNPKKNAIKTMIQNTATGIKNKVIPFPTDWPSNAPPYLLGVVIGWARLFSEYKVGSELGKGWILKHFQVPDKLQDMPWFHRTEMSSATQRAYQDFLRDIGVIETLAYDQVTLSLTLLEALIVRLSIDASEISLSDFINQLEDIFCIYFDPIYSRIDLVRRLLIIDRLSRGSDYDDMVNLRRESR